MTVHYRLPESGDLDVLTAEREFAVTIYIATSPVVSVRERNEVQLKSAFDEAVRQLEAAGGTAREVGAIRQERDAIMGDRLLWGALARSLAVFVAPGFSEVFVLPNSLDDAVHTGRHFTIGQLLRSTTSAQEAYAITLSGNEWRLWHATPTDRARSVDIDVPHPADAAEGSNRDEIGGRGRPNLSKVGDEGKKTFLDAYAKRVADAVWAELNVRDPLGRLPLFVFAAEPLLSMFDAHKEGRRVVRAPGASDRLDAADIDQRIREQLAALNAADTDAALRTLGEGDLGLVERDLAAIAKTAIEGAVGTFYFDFTTRVNGELDPATGTLRFAAGQGAETEFEDGSPADDVLPLVARLVLGQGGRAVAVRGSELDPALWQTPAVAELRYAIA